MGPLDDLVLLRAFLRILECGSISGAARTLKTPQPTLSRQLRQLEERAGLPLLRRDTHGMRLTETGRQLHADARVILEMADAAHARLSRDRSEIGGHLRIFATIDSGQSYVTRLLTAFLAGHPKITAELSYMNRPLQMVQEGFDAGIVAGALADDRVVAIKTGRILRYLVCSPKLLELQGRPRRTSDLAKWPWLSLSGRQFGDPRRAELIADDGAHERVEIAPRLLTEGVTSLREAVLSETGIAVLPHWLVRQDIEDGRLVRVLPRWRAPDLTAYVVYPASPRLPARVRAFIDFATEAVRGELRT
jgi:DNA-binding transcriptional LysR family regulator